MARRLGRNATNFERLQAQDVTETDFRDVYENQQLERSKLEKPQTPLSRQITAGLAGFGSYLLAWTTYTLGQYIMDMASSFGTKGLTNDKPQFELTSMSFGKFGFSFAVGAVVGGLVYSFGMKSLKAQNVMHDVTDINQYENDRHIMLPDEVFRTFDWFPNLGAHSKVTFSSMISHTMLSKKGLKSVPVAKRATEDMFDDDGSLMFYKGEILTDDDGNPVTEMQPIIDEDFGQKLFTASGVPEGKAGASIRKLADATKIEYNPGNKDRDKQKGFEKVKDLINEDWEFPLYETQRPTGAYIVDTAPVNTMVLAITRAGKGQTVIEPTLDMWTRQINPVNIVANDPKGELLVKNYVRATMRGYQVVQFNLINATKTDIYNPLGLASQAAREGDAVKCAQYVESIADVFFPTDGGEDPVWPNAANNAFKRAAYALIDYHLELEFEMRDKAEAQDWDAQVLETRLDELWGKVSLFNCYQLFVQLSAKKLKSPDKEIEAKIKSGELDEEEDEMLIDDLKASAQERVFLWENKPEVSMLDLYFTATETLPRNAIRGLIANAHNALKTMADSEKMLASVYGIAITAMSFFTDPTIRTLTSGTPSQNTDLAGMSFPRRIGVRFGSNYVKRYELKGLQVKWDAFADPEFTEPLGKDFEHEDIVSIDGWARYYFKGKFPQDDAYLRLRLVNAQTQMLNKTYYFHFTKSYQTSLNGRYYVTDPITEEKIVKNGTLIELQKETVDGKVVYTPGPTKYKQERLVGAETGTPRREDGMANGIISNTVRYSEKPKMVFLVTPPHLMKYAKLLLILIKQLVDLNFEQSYMTKSNQKPLYRTCFMLDELGNLQSEGNGISGFETMLSIGLGQEQQFTLILQTLQQLKNVYGETSDKVIQGNVSNIVFLKSTDDTMIETLTKMSGTTHVVRRNSKTVTRDMDKMVNQTEGKISYTMTTEEVPVIQFNDMMFIKERNSILFRAGNDPIWNRNETILPMSFKLFENTITHQGREYSLQTIPTLSSASEFDVNANQPDFKEMLETRVRQAEKAERAKKLYKEAYGLDDFGVARLDGDTYSNEVMTLIRTMAWNYEGENVQDIDRMPDDDETDGLSMQAGFFIDDDMMFDNEDQIEETAKAEARAEVLNEKKFAGGNVSVSDLVRGNGDKANGTLDQPIIASFHEVIRYMEGDTDHFIVRNGELYGAEGEYTNKPFIIRTEVTPEMQAMEAALREGSSDPNARVFDEGDEGEDVIGTLRDAGQFEVTQDFYAYLAGRPTWTDLAQGRFEVAMSKRMSPEM